MKLTIPKPCHENWETMTPEEKGKFCSVCSKTVHDFTAFSDEELINRFTLNENLCGRFREDQLGKNLNFSVARTMALGLLVGGGFIAAVNAQEVKPTDLLIGKIGKVAVSDMGYNAPSVRMGAPLLRPAAKPLILLDNKVISEEELRVFKPEKIKTVNTLSAEEAIKLYGNRGKNGVMVITSKKKK